MRNKYEFKIEDINVVKIITNLEDNYTITCTRKPGTNIFIETYSADNDESSNTEIGIVCPRCGEWNYCKKHEYSPDIYDIKCENCEPTYQISYTEDDLIDMIMENMNEESFFDIELYINGIHIK